MNVPMNVTEHFFQDVSVKVPWTSQPKQMMFRSKLEKNYGQDVWQLEREQEFEQEDIKWVCYAILLHRIRSSNRRVNPPELALFNALFADLLITRGFYAPKQLKYSLNRAILGTQTTNSHVRVKNITIQRIDKKHVLMQCKLYFVVHKIDRPHRTHVSHAIKTTQILENNSGRLRSSNVMIFSNNCDVHLLVEVFGQNATACIQQKKQANSLVDHVLGLQQRSGNDLCRVIPMPDKTNLRMFKIMNSISSDQIDAPTSGGIVFNVENPYSLMANLCKTKTSEMDVPENTPLKAFKGTLLFCSPQTKKYWKKQLNYAGLKAIEYRMSTRTRSMTKVQNRSDVVLIITFSQAARADTLLQSQYDMTLPLTCILDGERHSLYFLLLTRVIIADSHVLGPLSYSLGFLVDIQAREKWVIASHDLDCIELQLYSRQLLCTTAYFEYYIKPTISDFDGIVDGNSESKVLTAPFTLTKYGKEKQLVIKRKTLMHEIGPSELLVKKITLSSEDQQQYEACCICYETLSKELPFIEFRCKHYVCNSCYLHMKTPTKVKCPMCRVQNKFPADVTKLMLEDAKTEIIQAQPYTTKIEFIKLQLDFCETMQIGIVCRRASFPFILHYLPEHLRSRVHFVSQTHSQLALIVPYKICIYFQCRHDSPPCMCLHERTLKRVKTILFTYHSSVK